MNKIVLVDGNNLLFRSYYATAYNGNFMKNSKGFPTNALFGFTNMIHKIITEENPQYMIVAFDKGKTFRHEKYKDYKGGRMATPDELKMQFPKAKELLTAMGIKYYEIDNYEADDILGTFARYCDEEPNFIGTIISSDKDLLQLISNDVDIKLLKQKDYIRYNKESFIEAFGFEPKHIVDLKALMGDSSDNIPGVKGVGEKTAMKLIGEYKTIDNLYDHIEDIKGALKEKLISGKDGAYEAHELATIVKNVPLDIQIPDIKYLGPKEEELNKIYEDLEFYSFMKKLKTEKKELKKEDIIIAKTKEDLKIEGPCSIYLEILGTNYHTSEILGMAVYNEDNSFFVPFELLKEDPSFLTENEKYTYDLKKTFVSLKWNQIPLKNVTFDTMISAYLLDYNVKEDIAYLAKELDYDIPFYDTVYGKTKFQAPSIEEVASMAIEKAKFIYETKKHFEEEMKKQEVDSLFSEIEMPLSSVLADMEYTGMKVDKETLLKMGEELQEKIHQFEKVIYDYAGCEFNISSPKQLGEVLFEKMEIPHGKKTATGYSTAADVLMKLRSYHPIIDMILEYRTVTKLYNTYIEGLSNLIMEDGKVHTIYQQTLTRTGRLSSIEPNLQNIPVRNEYGKLIRKAFVPSKDSVILSGDYSQIELRILAHMANVPSLIEAFQNGMDIHTKTAMDIFHVTKEEVDSNKRRIAKAVNFGIIYGISGFGLSENIGISVGEAQNFINTYLKTYSGIDAYMKQVIEQAKKDGYVTTLFHRKRIIPELSNKNLLIRKQGERMALNTPIQGTSADIIKKAMVEIYEELNKRNLKTKMIIQVHDELIFDTPKEELEEVKKLVKEKMEHVITLRVPLSVEFGSGDNWYLAK